MAVAQTFTDISLDFLAHPVTGDIATLKNDEAVKRSIKNLIFTDIYERHYSNNKLGSGIRQLLFQNINPMTEKAIEDSIKNVVRAYEKRATLIEVKASVNADENGYNVKIVFSVDQISKFVSIDMFLERVR